MKLLASKRAPAVLIIIIVAVVSLLFGYSFWEERQKLKQLSAEAPAVITSVYVNSTRGRRGGTSHRTHLTYSYVVNGKTMSGKTIKAGDVRTTYQVRMPATACYDPSNPAQAEVFPPDYKCGQ
jgi:hypothetical protein